MRRARRWSARGGLPALLLAAFAPWPFACADAPGPRVASIAWGDYRPDRRDYAAFREGYPEILEPNYLPFMVHRKPGDPASGDLLLFCRWPDEAMPLPVFIETAEIPESIQNEFDPVDPARFADAARRALHTWEEALEGLVSFRLVSNPEEASLRLRLQPERAPSPEPQLRVLGVTAAVGRACRPQGWDPESERMDVRFEVPEAVVYVADEFGLLTETQVEAVALHEIGHALGMRGHSPLPTDLMYRVLGERVAAEGLSEDDVNSFVSLYRLPNGTHYGHVQPGGPTPRAPPVPPSGGPRLALAPHVDTRLGFELRAPAGWVRAPHRHGLFTADGPIWDHAVSLEIFVWPYPTVEAFLDRFGPDLFAGTWRRYSAPVVVAERPGVEVAVEDATGEIALDFFLIELGDGRVMVILASCPVSVEKDWRPWFEAVLATIEIR